MKCVLFSFSERGKDLADRIAEAMGNEMEIRCVQPKGDLMEQTEAVFSSFDALVYIGACGIAVRAIAPCVRSKTSDPAVLVVDERGQFVISLLSGHIGRANELAKSVANVLGAQPVITTATDVNGRFSVDAWASKNGLLIEDMNIAKQFSAEILTQDLALYSDLPLDDELPSGIFLASSGEFGAAVTYRDIRPFARTLRLFPRCLHLGIGCRRGASREQIRALVHQALSDCGIDFRAVCRIASIDIKSDEEGLLAFAAELGAECTFFTAAELQALSGDFSASDFVREHVGVDNVCERAAMRSAGEGATLIVGKKAADGVTVAVALEKRRLSFE